MRIVYLGMGGMLSLAPLEALLEAGCPVQAVVVPGPSNDPLFRELTGTPSPSPLPVASPFVVRSIVHLAWERGIPAFETGGLNAAAVQREWQRLAPDLVCVSCFSRRIPDALLAQPRHGFLNLHPSPLPAYRGPFPLFWQLRDGARETSVTLHFMSEALDAGDIALQAPLSLPEGASGVEIERLAGEHGGRLFVEAVRRLEAGTLPRRPQKGLASYQPAPVAADFALSTRWPAQRAFNFMRGTAEWGFPYPVDVAGQTLRLRRAIAYRPAQQLSSPWLASGAEVQVQFTPGVLRATRAV